MVATETLPEAKTSNTDKNKDDRVRHIVERLSPKGVEPIAYSKVALCGYRIRELVETYSEEICQKCVDIQRKKGWEK